MTFLETLRRADLFLDLRFLTDFVGDRRLECLLRFRVAFGTRFFGVAFLVLRFALPFEGLTVFGIWTSFGFPPRL